MQLLWISGDLIKKAEVDDLETLLADDSGFLWLDIESFDEPAAALLADTFRFHPVAIQACARRSHVPRVHAYPNALFVVLHAPEPGEPGHVHLVELDQFIGVSFLVTVHGPLGAGVPLEAALHETEGVRTRLLDGRLKPRSPADVSHAIVSGIARKQERFVSDLATRIASLERRIMRNEASDPESLLEEMFKLRHELLTIRTMSAQARQALARMASLVRFLPDQTSELIRDLEDQFDRIRSICDGEKEFLQGVLDFYQSRITTKINVAMERLALIAAVMLPVSAIAGIYGMNIIVPDRTDPLHIIGVLGIMGTVVVTMFAWAKRQGWW